MVTTPVLGQLRMGKTQNTRSTRLPQIEEKETSTYRRVPESWTRDFGPMIAFCLSRVSDSCPP